MIRRPILSAIRSPIASAFERRSAAAASLPVLVQETDPIYTQGTGTTVSTLTFDQASTAGNTLIVHMSAPYFNTITFADSAGGIVTAGQWTRETNGDPLANTSVRLYTWVRRNCPAGITSVSITSNASPFNRRIYLKEVSGLDNVAPIQVFSAVAAASQVASAYAAPSAGFLSVLQQFSPSRTPVSASAGTDVRRLNFLSDNVTPYAGAVSEFTAHGSASGARNFDASWADGAATTGYFGVFIPAA